MENINSKKRAVYAKKVMIALQRILNDSSIMTNVDSSDLVVSISSVNFGKTVREIYIDVFGYHKKPNSSLKLHDQYIERAKKSGSSTYIDLTDIFIYPELTHIVACELQMSLKLQYVPTIRLISDIGVRNA